eukprot:Clim_evm26s14 gene=Clim_evmTU26s14
MLTNASRHVFGRLARSVATRTPRTQLLNQRRWYLEEAPAEELTVAGAAKAVARFMGYSAVFATGCGIVLGLPIVFPFDSLEEGDIDKLMNIEEANNPVHAVFLRAKMRYEGLTKSFADPSSDKLLPDMPPSHQAPATLVINLDEVLVHSEWSPTKGWRVLKRAGVNPMLATLMNYYEIVIWSDKSPGYAGPIIEKIDPHTVVPFRLFRDATKWEGRKHVKDLTYLNRDPSRVVIVDVDPEVVRPRENALIIKKWEGPPKDGKADEDHGLMHLTQFLEALARSGVEDVRPVLESYKDSEDPLADFLENQKRAAEEHRQRMEEHRHSFTASLFGGRPAVASAPVVQQGEPQAVYEQEEPVAAEEQHHASRGSLWSWLGLVEQPPAEQPQEQSQQNQH